MMINEKKLKEKIEKIESISDYSIDFKNAKKLIEKIQGEYVYGMPREEFINLVNGWAKKLELHYNYCRVAFSYLSGNKEKAQVNNSTEHLQEAFPFDKKIIFTRAEI